MKKNVSKIALLWVIVMVGFMAHTVAELLPAFWGANIAIDGSTGEAPTGMLILMTAVSFFIPMCGLFCMQYHKSKAMRVVNLVLAVVMMLFNVIHAGELFTEFSPVQLLIHPVMAVIGVYLFVFSIQVLKQEPNTQPDYAA